MYRQDVFANNLANVQTVGYKADRPTISQRPAEAQANGTMSEFHNALLDNMGGGALAGRQTLDLTPGEIRPTGHPMDVALQSRNAFFAVQSKDGMTGQVNTRLTRDGRFTADAQGRLVTAATGLPVLDKDDRTIQLRPGLPVTIHTDGQVIQGGQSIAQLQITAANQPEQLVKQGKNLFWSANGTDPRQQAAAGTQLATESVEGSSVDPVQCLMDLVNATKAVTMNGNMIRYQDQVMDQTVNVLGRVSG
jgi:flagellar basal-body rod protein FlgF